VFGLFCFRLDGLLRLSSVNFFIKVDILKLDTFNTEVMCLPMIVIYELFPP